MSNSMIFYVGVVLAVIGILIAGAGVAHLFDLRKTTALPAGAVVLLVGLAVAWYGRRAQAA